MQLAPNAQDKIKVTDVVVSTKHVTFLTNRFPRLISFLTSAIFVSGTSGSKSLCSNFIIIINIIIQYISIFIFKKTFEFGVP